MFIIVNSLNSNVACRRKINLQNLKGFVSVSLILRVERLFDCQKASSDKITMTFTDVKKKNDLRRKMTGAHFSQEKKDPATNRGYYSVLVHNAAVLKNL